LDSKLISSIGDLVTVSYFNFGVQPSLTTKINIEENYGILISVDYIKYLSGVNKIFGYEDSPLPSSLGLSVGMNMTLK